MYGPILSFVLVVSKFRITHGEFLRGREYPVGFSLKRGWLIVNVIAKKKIKTNVSYGEWCLCGYMLHVCV